ncbi:pirin family protein [Gordonia sp. NPDC003429]
MSTTNVRAAGSSTVIRAKERHHWNDESIESRQSFPATGNFDLARNAHGLLLVHNDDLVDAGSGFDTHRHQDAEIVTWVVEGALHHKDSAGNSGVLVPGVVQRMSAGTGITHSERNASTRVANQRLRVVQMWIAPEYAGVAPGYAETDVTDALADGDLITVVSGLQRDADAAALDIANGYVALHAARLRPMRPVTIPSARYGHLYVVKGDLTVTPVDNPTRPITLHEGDALRTTDGPEMLAVTGRSAEILFWEMHTGFDDAPS